MSRRAGVLIAVFACAACAGSKAPVPVAPAAPPPTSGPPQDEHTFVSTSNNEAKRAPRAVSVTTATGTYVVTTPEAAKALAQSAVADQLDPRKTWKTSPVLPTTWPAKERAVIVFFYPMAANPRSMVHYQLFTPAYGVKVSLVDGATSIQPIAKGRELGMIEETRPSSLERRELDMAEASLVQQLMGTEIDTGDNPYWGYLKFIHEHPQLGKDLQRRSPAFLGWVKKRYGK